MMIEFALPANSRIGIGKTWPAPAGATRIKNFKVYRSNPDDGQNPRLDTFRIDLDDCRTHGVEINSALTFRRSCREGICGSCAMNIDGGTDWLACTKAIDEIKGVSDLSVAPHAGDQRARPGSDARFRAIPLDPAVIADGNGAAARSRATTRT